MDQLQLHNQNPCLSNCWFHTVHQEWDFLRILIYFSWKIILIGDGPMELVGMVAIIAKHR